MKWLHLVAVSLLAVCLQASWICAGTVVVSGRVVDDDGQPIANAAIGGSRLSALAQDDDGDEVVVEARVTSE